MNHKPSEPMTARISVMMDGEADSSESAAVADVLLRDRDMRGNWERYHLIRDVMRGDYRSGQELPSPTSRAPSAPARIPSTWRSRWRPAAGMALAASVSALAVLAFVPAGTPDVEKVATEGQTSPLTTVVLPPPSSSPWPSSPLVAGETLGPRSVSHNPNLAPRADYRTPQSPAWPGSLGELFPQPTPEVGVPMDSRFAGYLLSHNERARGTGMSGILPYVRLVGHESQGRR